MVVRRILAGALLAPLLVLSACGGDDASVADPPVSPTSPSTSTADPPHRESAKAFIRRWAVAERKMENTGQADAYLAISRGCDACKKLANQIEGFYAAGGFVQWGGWEILSIRPNSKMGKTVTFAVRNRSLPTRYKESSDGPLKHLAGGTTTELLRLESQGNTWNLVSKAELAS